MNNSRHAINKAVAAIALVGFFGKTERDTTIRPPVTTKAFQGNDMRIRNVEESVPKHSEDLSRCEWSLTARAAPEQPVKRPAIHGLKRNMRSITRTTRRKRGGTEGRMYPGSFDCEKLKKRNGKNAQQKINSAGEFSHPYLFHFTHSGPMATIIHGNRSCKKNGNVKPKWLGMLKYGREMARSSCAAR